MLNDLHQMLSSVICLFYSDKKIQRQNRKHHFTTVFSKDPHPQYLIRVDLW